MSNIADSKTNEPETTVPVQPAHAAQELHARDQPHRKR